jgi:hypothetical protein
MPGRGTKKRTLRVEDAIWDPFGDAVQAVGRDRNGVLKAFMRWYLRHPDEAAEFLARIRDESED